MKLWKILVVATAAECAAVGGAAGFIGLGGAWNGWLDAFNQFAPIWFVLTLAGAATFYELAPKGLGRRVVLAVAVAGALVSGALILPDIVRSIGDDLATSSKPAALVLATFNVWEDNPTPSRLIDTLIATHADVIAIQEIHGTIRKQADRLLATHPYRVQCDRGMAADIAIYSALAPIGQGCLSAPWINVEPSSLQAVWIRVLARDGRPATVVTTHQGWPVPPGPQEKQSAALAKFLQGFDRSELILAGDFNLAPWSFALRRQDGRLRPLSRRTHALFTWPTVFGRLGAPMPIPLLPIDQVYAGASWRIAKIHRLPRAGSDHYGLLATLYR